MNKDIIKLIEYVEDRIGHDWRYAMDISKIKNELGWSPRIKFHNGIKELIDEDSFYAFGHHRSIMYGGHYPEVFTVPADFCNFGKSRKL